MRTITLVALLAVWLPARTTGNEFYVALDGGDDAEGTRAEPFATLPRALAAARGTEGGDTIVLRAGRYPITETVMLTGLDSGAVTSPLIIRSAPGEGVHLTGGAAVPPGSFQPIEDPELLARLPETSRGYVVAAPLAGTGLESFFELRAVPQVFEKSITNPRLSMLSCNGYVLQKAQWPNRGYGHLGDILTKGPWTRDLKPGEAPEPYSDENPSGALVQIREAIDLAALAREVDRTHDMQMNGYFSNDWLYEMNSVGQVDPEAETIQLLHYSRYGVFLKKGMMPRRVHIINALCQLDEPGEWYYDSKDRRLFLYPVQPVQPSDQFTVVGGPTLVRGTGIEHVILRGITFENFGATGVVFTDSRHVTIAGCTFRAGAERGLQVQGTHNEVRSCDFYDLETAFGLVGYEASRASLTLEHNQAVNNHIRNCRRRGYGLIDMRSVGARFAHNLLHDQNGGMFIGKQDALVEYNEFYNMGYEMGDWNAVYMGGDIASDGNLIRHNFFHHFMESGGHPITAHRGDDGATGLHAFGNIYFKTGRGAGSAAGAHTSMRNALVMETRFLLTTVQSPYQEEPVEDFLQTKWDEHQAMQARVAAGTLDPMEKGNYLGRAELLMGPGGWTNNPAWDGRYPHIADRFHFFDPDRNPWRPSYIALEDNYVHGTAAFPAHVHGPRKIDSYQAAREHFPATAVIEEATVFDPEAMFANYKELDLRLRENFPLAHGFEPIPFEKIGLFLDAYRTEVPDKCAYRKTVARRFQGVRSYGNRYDPDVMNLRFPRPAYLSYSSSTGS